MSVIAAAAVPLVEEQALPTSQRELYDAVADAVRSGHALLGVEDHESLSALGSLDAAARWLDGAIAALGDALAAGMRGACVTRAVAALTRLYGLRVRVADLRTRTALADQDAVRGALARMRGSATLEQLMARVPEELCRCGFDRAWISCLQECDWRLRGCHVVGDQAAGPAIVLAAPRRWPLAPNTHEAQLVRMRTAILVADADEHVDPVIAELLAPRSYVAAPLLVGARVVGFVHAERCGSRLADEGDRRLIALFAEGAAHVLQRVVLAERFEALRVDVRRMTQVFSDTVDDVCWANIDLAPKRPPIAVAGAEPTRSRPGTFAAGAGSARLAALLTSREIEVVRLMAAGETNAGIASQLVITEGTVKSHVKRILRKLHAANRAQAVSRYFRIVQAGVVE